MAHNVRCTIRTTLAAKLTAGAEALGQRVQRCAAKASKVASMILTGAAAQHSHTSYCNPRTV